MSDNSILQPLRCIDGSSHLLYFRILSYAIMLTIVGRKSNRLNERLRTNNGIIAAEIALII